MIFRQDNELDTETRSLQEWRRNRFRVLVCIDGSDASYEGIRYAAELAGHEDCDIILLYVRPIDQGLRSGGLQVRVARQNMLEWGLELPGIQYLKNGLDMLVDSEQLAEEWTVQSDHADVWGDPLGDNKIEYKHANGQSIVLKLKTAPEPASGILDQYELGPYNLIIMGAPDNWRAEWRSFWGAGVVQKVVMMAPCSVMVSRKPREENVEKQKYLICTDGSAHSLDAACRSAVLAQHCNHPITLVSTSQTHSDKSEAEGALHEAKAMLAEMGVKVSDTIVRVGNTVDAIVDAGRDYDVIAVSGSGKRKWVKRLFGDSVSYSVMGKSECSVLNVHHKS